MAEPRRRSNKHSLSSISLSGVSSSSAPFTLSCSLNSAGVRFSSESEGSSSGSASGLSPDEPPSALPQAYPWGSEMATRGLQSSASQPSLSTENERASSGVHGPHSQSSGLNIKVAVRVRPINQHELGQGCQVALEVGEDGQTIRAYSAHSLFREAKVMTFDKVYGAQSSQKHIFEDLAQPLVEEVVKGYKACIFAYGMTGSGKTFALTGNPQNPGLSARVAEDLFAQLEMGREQEDRDYSVQVSYTEVYNETVRDLIASGGKGGKVGGGPRTLDIRESSLHGVYVKGLSSLRVSSPAEVNKVKADGDAIKKESSHQLNPNSSRSHTILTLRVKTWNFSGNGEREERVGKLELIDLAGSERLSKTHLLDPVKVKEASGINKSLGALGEILAKLSAGTSSAPSHVPYRNSKLTRLLQESLGGNCITVMLCCVTPADAHLDDTLHTLQYAAKAKKIKTKPNPLTILPDPTFSLAMSQKVLHTHGHCSSLASSSSSVGSSCGYPSCCPSGDMQGNGHIGLSGAVNTGAFRGLVADLRFLQDDLLSLQSEVQPDNSDFLLGDEQAKDSILREISEKKVQIAAMNSFLDLHRSQIRKQLQDRLNMDPDHCRRLAALRQSTLGRMKVADIVKQLSPQLLNASLPPHLLEDEIEGLEEADKTLAQARRSYEAGKTLIRSHKANLVKELLSLTHLLPHSESFPTETIKKALEAAEAKARSVVGAAQGLSCERSAAVEAVGELVRRTTHLLDLLLLHSFPGPVLESVPGASQEEEIQLLGAIDDLEYARARLTKMDLVVASLACHVTIQDHEKTSILSFLPLIRPLLPCDLSASEVEEKAELLAHMPVGEEEGSTEAVCLKDSFEALHTLLILAVASYSMAHPVTQTTPAPRTQAPAAHKIPAPLIQNEEFALEEFDSRGLRRRAQGTESTSDLGKQSLLNSKFDSLAPLTSADISTIPPEASCIPSNIGPVPAVQQQQGFSPAEVRKRRSDELGPHPANESPQKRKFRTFSSQLDVAHSPQYHSKPPSPGSEKLPGSSEQEARRRKNSDAANDTVETLQKELEVAHSTLQATREEVGIVKRDLLACQARVQELEQERADMMSQAPARVEQIDNELINPSSKTSLCDQSVQTDPTISPEIDPLSADGCAPLDPGTHFEDAAEVLQNDDDHQHPIFQKIMTSVAEISVGHIDHVSHDSAFDNVNQNVKELLSSILSASEHMSKLERRVVKAEDRLKRTGVTSPATPMTLMSTVDSCKKITAVRARFAPDTPVICEESVGVHRDFENNRLREIQKENEALALQILEAQSATQAEKKKRKDAEKELYRLQVQTNKMGSGPSTNDDESMEKGTAAQSVHYHSRIAGELFTQEHKPGKLIHDEDLEKEALQNLNSKLIEKLRTLHIEKKEQVSSHAKREGLMARKYQSRLSQEIATPVLASITQSPRRGARISEIGADHGSQCLTPTRSFRKNVESTSKVEVYVDGKLAVLSPGKATVSHRSNILSPSRRHRKNLATSFQDTENQNPQSQPRLEDMERLVKTVGRESHLDKAPSTQDRRWSGAMIRMPRFW